MPPFFCVWYGACNGSFCRPPEETVLDDEIDDASNDDELELDDELDFDDLDEELELDDELAGDIRRLLAA